MEGEFLLADQGNWTLDIDFEHIEEPLRHSNTLDRIFGANSHELFIRFTAIIIIGKNDSTQTINF
ncbi:Ribose 5-phosphate isomerase A (phosphoriboisomerase A) [Algoriphagus winogradskyi]|uniref:Ribose 5-phosphate isomerase A (Phosphoriboisomerase A) n=2 Tax=Algoriphagus winogradskyi TaxID=237017 RepID=A0ABY1N9R0_9BACT|nr:Ribose 5-phosphate isomerase A (phosphoriboisomerase A) [Algoriphagus winogradskyi]